MPVIRPKQLVKGGLFWSAKNTGQSFQPFYLYLFVQDFDPSLRSYLIFIAAKQGQLEEPSNKQWPQINFKLFSSTSNTRFSSIVCFLKTDIDSVSAPLLSKTCNAATSTMGGKAECLIKLAHFLHERWEIPCNRKHEQSFYGNSQRTGHSLAFHFLRKKSFTKFFFRRRILCSQMTSVFH